MPALFIYDDYKQCQAIYRDNFTYCVVNVRIQPNSSPNLWRQIKVIVSNEIIFKIINGMNSKDFSKHHQYHFRHDKLKRGVCLSKHLYEMFEPLKNQQLVMNKTINKKRIAKTVMTSEMQHHYGLTSESDVKFCMTKETERLRMSKTIFRV